MQVQHRNFFDVDFFFFNSVRVNRCVIAPPFTLFPPPPCPEPAPNRNKPNRHDRPDAAGAPATHANSQIYRILPYREAILEGVLSSDIIGFQTYDYARHFLSTVESLLDANCSPQARVYSCVRACADVCACLMCVRTVLVPERRSCHNSDRCVCAVCCLPACVRLRPFFGVIFLLSFFFI